MIEGAKLEMQVLKENQELQHELERIKKGKAELNRKLELSDAKTKVQQTEIDLMLEQTVERETDGMNDYLKEYYKQNDVKEEVLPQLGDSGTRPSLESKPGDNRVTVSDEQLPTCGIQSQLLSSSAQVSLGLGSVVTFSSVPRMAPAVSLGSSASFALTQHMESRTSLGSVTKHPPYLNTTLAPDTTQASLYTTASLSPVSFQLTPIVTAQYCAPRTSVNATATEFHPVFESQQNTHLPTQYPYLSPQSLTSIQQSQALTTIAQAIKQGPTLPKVELMKLSGDLLEYAEFVTNFNPLTPQGFSHAPMEFYGNTQVEKINHIRN